MIQRAVVPRDVPPHILALTANTRKENYDADLETGMHSYLSKPFETPDLVSALARAHDWLSANGRSASTTVWPQLDPIVL